jgi:hypothetical protein
MTAIAAAGMLGLARDVFSADVKRISLSECLKMNPIQDAENSEMLSKGINYLKYMISRIESKALRGIGERYLENPAPTLIKRFANTSEREKTAGELVKAGYIKPEVTHQLLLPKAQPGRAPQPALTTPGSGYQSHHSYPGGLITHLAANVSIAKHIADTYPMVYGYDVNNDIVILAQLLHDFHKPWVFQWKDDFETLAEVTVAGTGAHHILSIAEALYCNFPPELTVAMASAHASPTSEEDRASIMDWIKAAGIIAGIDPYKTGVLKGDDGMELFDRQENYITHLGDHDWVLSVPAAQKTIGALKTIAAESYKINVKNAKDFNSFRNYVFSQTGAMTLHNVWANKGINGLMEYVKTVVAA